MPSSSARRKMDEVKRSLADPAGFAQHWLDLDIWSKQQEILRAVARCSRVAVKACHASGKTFVAGVAALWWITTQEEAMAITTAPTWVQVQQVLWPEIATIAADARIAYPKPTATALRLGPGRYAMGLSTNEGIRFQGFHGNVLIIIDEAPGVLPGIYEAIDGIRAGGDVRVLALGNPIIASGPFFEAFASQRQGWNLITISAFDTPNLQGVSLEDLLAMPDQELDQNPLAYLTSRRWVKERYLEWGADHPLWQSRVLGNFPLQAQDALLSLTWLEMAKLRVEGEGDVFAGIDVAGPGDAETVLCVRRGPRIVLLKAWAGRDPRGEIVAALMPFKSQLKGVNVDSVGIGFYFAQHLRDHRLPVKEINVAKAAADPGKYSNLKAEVYWKFRLRAESGDLAGLTDDKAIGQLAGIRYRHNSRGQIEIESKDEAAKRGVKSPDRAEAVVLAFADVSFSHAGVFEFCRQEADKARAYRQAHPGHVWEKLGGRRWL
jgi:phage terminase large subunit